MVRKPDATMQPAPQDNQLMSKRRVLSLKPQLRLEWRGQDGQSETEQPDHSASLGDSITSSTQIRFSVVPVVNQIPTYWWCSPPRTGRQSMRPAGSTARETGASFSKDRCVRTSL